MSLTLTARWVVPISSSPLPNGLVTIEGGRIVAVEPAGTRVPTIDLGDTIVLPGLVNAHTHLDLSGMRDLAPPSFDFPGWLRRVIAHRRARSQEQIAQDIRAGLAECLRTGTTLVGDISGDGTSFQFLRESPLAAVVFRELLGLPEDRAAAAIEAFEWWQRSQEDTPRCRRAISPHAPYSVRSSLYLFASTRGLPVATHLAETREELQLLGDRQGPFVEFLKQVGVWSPAGLADNPQHVLKLLNGPSPTVLIHGNYLPPEVTLPARSSVIYCPRTHAAFGHGPHPFREFLARGVNVALGTDSLASNPDLDMLAEARFFQQRHPDVPGEVVLKMITLNGARALGWDDEFGSLEPGKWADLVVVGTDLTPPPPLRCGEGEKSNLTPLPPLRTGEGGPEFRPAGSDVLLPLSAPERGSGGEVQPHVQSLLASSSRIIRVMSRGQWLDDDGAGHVP